MTNPNENGKTLKFKCSVDLCFKEYKDKSELKKHFDKIHHGINYGCTFCSKKIMVSKFKHKNRLGVNLFDFYSYRASKPVTIT